MSPTINDGAHLAVDKFSLRFRSPHRGEIVVARRPDSGELVVKRVVAVGGDSVGIDDGRLLLNGSLVDEPYADLGGMPGRFWGPDIVPSGEVFLLGDQRAESEDSRVFGSVELDAIVGRVIGA
jgi:signal peptidase I